ncbi:oligosaccharide flippase family protein [Candidatus Saccharibacteria bacterium]|nr:oligosaccharide flippase family protein [Candidatus Saccharibacteria bacterium]
MKKIKRLLRTYHNMNSQAKAGIWFVFCSFFQKGIAFITIPIFTRVLTTEEYGVTNLFNTWSTLLVIFATLNLSGGVYNRGLLEFDEKKYTSSVQSLATTISAIVTALIIIFHDFLSSISGLSSPVLYIMCLHFFTTAALNLWTVKQRFFYRYKALVLVTITNTIISAGLGLLAAILSTSSRGEAKVIWSTLGGILVALPFYIYNFGNGKTFYDKKMWKYSLDFNLPLVPHYLSNLILHQSDRIMINWFCGTSDVAYYSVAYSVSSLVSVFTDAINQTLTPWRYQNMKRKNYSRINKISLTLLALVAGIVVIANLLAPEIIYIFGGTKYSEAMWTIPPIMLSVYFIFMYGMFSNVEFYFLKTKFMMVASMVSAILNIALNYIFIGKFGYIACAYTSLLCYMIYTACHYLYMRHICKKEIGHTNIFNIRTIGLITIIVFILAALSTALYNISIVRYLLIIIAIIVAIMKKKTIINTLKTIKK